MNVAPMLNLILRRATILDNTSPYNGQTMDIWMEGDMIRKIGRDLPMPDGATEYTASGLHVSKGWIDMQCMIGEPGFESCETLQSASEAAIAGGFTTLCMLPVTHPRIDNRAQVEFIFRRDLSLPVHILPYGALTVQCEGKDMAELLDMADAGIRAFTDGKSSIENPKLLELILQYASQHDLLVVHHSDTPALTRQAQMHEGINSTALGLKGFPAIAEMMAVERDLHLLTYAGGRLHIPLVSSKETVETIRRAKASGQKVSCGVASQYLLFTDLALQTFDPMYKVNPPYRTDEDRMALIDGIADGTIDIICSDHTPVDDEHKIHELAHADFGITNLETAFATARTATSSYIDISTLIESLTSHPASLLGIQQPSIAEGQRADITLFQPDEPWQYNADSSHSLSHNSPFNGFLFTGKPLGVICKSKLHLS